MRAFHQKKTAEKDGSPLRLALLALALTVTMELFNHKAFSEGPAAFWAFLAKRPLAAAVDYLLVLLTLLPTLFARRRTFWQTLLSVVWLGVGAANGFILLNRMTPFTIADLTVLNTGLDTLPNYLSPGYILLLAAAVAAALAGLTVLFWKGKRCPLPWKQRAKAGLLSTAAAAAALAGTWALAFHTHQLSAEFANLAYAYEDYGLPYCFLQTWLNKGIRCPAGYSSAAMDRVAGMIGEETPVNMGGAADGCECGVRAAGILHRPGGNPGVGAVPERGPQLDGADGAVLLRLPDGPGGGRRYRQHGVRGPHRHEHPAFRPR